MTSPVDPTRALLSVPEFRALLGARALSALGMSAIATVVAFQTYEVTGEPLALGLLGLVEAIPALTLMLFGGHVADRRDRLLLVVQRAVLAAVDDRAGPGPAGGGGTRSGTRAATASGSPAGPGSITGSARRAGSSNDFR